MQQEQLAEKEENTPFLAFESTGGLASSCAVSWQGMQPASVVARLPDQLAACCGLLPSAAPSLNPMGPAPPPLLPAPHFCPQATGGVMPPSKSS